jgi:hypothetical protein
MSTVGPSTVEPPAAIYRGRSARPAAKGAVGSRDDFARRSLLLFRTTLSEAEGSHGAWTFTTAC